MMQKDVAIGLQEKNLDRLKRRGGFKFTNTFFPYASGEIGPYYVQSGVVQNNGHDLAEAVSNMAFMVEQTIGVPYINNNTVISGGETRDWIFSLPIATQLKIPHAMLYKNGKIVGANMNGKKVIHIADLNNEGSSPRDYWVPAIKGAGGKITDIFFYVDRMERGTKVIKELGLKSHVLVPLNEHAWDYLKQEGILSQEIYNNLRQRMEDQDGWARRMLRSEVGLGRLVELIQDDKTLAKVKKIIGIGYPDMQEELINRIKKIDSQLLVRVLIDPKGGLF